ncbi:hemolin [Amyelois transitella]|uniref:hemolin n=1 Tax=Amyelois transitella TaxID=680683 RepID=UPI00299039E6|nr:hemolin [Amyelois transitella]
MSVIRACVVLGLLAVASSQPVNNLPVLKEAPQEVLFREGTPFAVECVTASGDGKLFKYKWTKNGQPLNLKDNANIVQRQNEGTLVFLRPSISDEGAYQCLGESQYGTASTRVIQIRRTYLEAQKYEVQKHTPIEGRTFKLDCPAPKAYPKPDIEWRSLQAADPIVSGEIQDARITVGPDGALYFANVTEDDASERFKYVCLASSPAVDKPVVLAEHFISSLKKDTKPQDHEVVLQYASPDTTARVGDMIFLYCIYGGNPLAHPDWFKDGKDVNNEPGARITRYNRSVGKRLLIRGVLPEDEGVYRCAVDNEVGKKQEHTMKLTVVGAPKFTKKPEKITTVKQGDDITIPCEVSGLPAPKLTYTYSAEPLKSARVTAANGFSIKKIEKTDSGYYGCNATNEYGSAYYETLVNVV